MSPIFHSSRESRAALGAAIVLGIALIGVAIFLFTRHPTTGEDVSHISSVTLGRAQPDSLPRSGRIPKGRVERGAPSSVEAPPGAEAPGHPIHGSDKQTCEDFEDGQEPCLLWKEIDEMASSKSAEELLAVVLERCRPPLETEDESSWKASWALLAQADRNPAEVCALLEATLLGLTEKGTVSVRVLAILGWCQHEEATAVLLSMLSSGWDIDRGSLLDALLNSGRGCELNLELQLREIEKLPVESRKFFFTWPPSPPDRGYAPYRADVCGLLVELFESGAKQWNLRDRKSLGYALGDIVDNWLQYERWLREKGKEYERPEYLLLIPDLLKKHIAAAGEAEERLCLIHSLSQCEPIDPDVWRVIIDHAQNEPTDRARLDCLPYCYPYRNRREVSEKLLEIGRYDISQAVRCVALELLPAEGEYLDWKMCLALQEYETAQQDNSPDRFDKIAGSIRILETCRFSGIAPLEKIARNDPDVYVRHAAAQSVTRLKAKCEREAEEARRREESDKFWADVREGRMPHIPEKTQD